MDISPQPVAGVPFDVQFVGTAGAPVTIKNLSSGSSAGNQIVTGTNQDAFLSLGGQPSARFIRTIIGGTSYYVLQGNGVHRPREFNVLDYGFDPTGINANDSAIATLEAAVSAYVTSTAVGAGATALIFFPYGTYTFSNPWPVFPGGTKFQGAYAYGYSSYYAMGQGVFIQFSGVGQVFIQVAAYQTYTDLAIMATASIANPSQSANIAGVSSGAGGVIELATSSAHGYSTGDLINVFGVSGFSNSPSLINSDPTTPHTITVVDSTHFSINGSVYSNLTGSGYAPVSVAVTGTSGTASPIELTVTAHGCTEGQLVYVSGVGGTTAANGAWRVHVVDANHVELYVNYYTGSTGNSAWTSGGTLVYGGTSCSNSHVPLSGLYFPETASIVHVERCSVGGFKYGCLVAGGEIVTIENCNFNVGVQGHGFVNDLWCNNSTHSAYPIAIGSFFGSGGNDVANMVFIDKCQFEGYKGIYHHDGINHHVTRCNFECPIMATISGGEVVVYEKFQNDGTNMQSPAAFAGDTTAYDCIELVDDTNGGNTGCYNLRVADGEASAAGGGALIHGYSSSVHSLTFGNLNFDGPGNMIQGSNPWLNGTVSNLGGNVVSGGGGISDGLVGGPDRTGGSASYQTTIGHWYAPTAYLDVLAVGVASTRVPMMQIRNPSQGAAFVYHNRDITLNSGGFYGGSIQEWDQIISNDTAVTGGRSVKSTGWVALAGGASPSTICTVDVPLTYGCGVLEAVVQCDEYLSPGTSSSFRIRQRFTVNSTTSLITPIDELEVVDNIGGLTVPTLSFSGSAGAFTAVVNITAHASLGTSWTATLTSTFTAYQ
jgi:hypothetical protein